MKYDYTCTNDECQHEFTISVYGSEVWEEECPKCNQEIDTDEFLESTKQDPDRYEGN